MSYPGAQSRLVAELAPAPRPLVSFHVDWALAPFSQAGLVFFFFFFVLIWKCGCREADYSRETHTGPSPTPFPQINGAWTSIWQLAEKQIKTEKLSSPFSPSPHSDRLILESDRRLMESLNFPDNKLPPSAIIKRFTTNSFLLHNLPHRFLLL